MAGAIKVKKESSWLWLALGTSEAARGSTAWAVAGTKTRVWEEFSEAMESDSGKT